MKIIFIDIDNTLVYHGLLHPDNISEIKRARSKGNKVIINTGRSREYMPWNLMENIEFDGIIAGLGSYVEYEGKVIYSNPIPAEVVAKTADLFSKNGKWIKYEGERSTILQNTSDGKHKVICSGEEFLTDFRDMCVSKFTADKLSEDELHFLSKDYTICNYVNYSEGARLGLTKKSGIEKLLSHLSVGKKDCIGIGDSINDIGMFEMCKERAAMGNAAPEIMEICTYTACHAAEGGVADAIRHFIK